MANLSIQRSRLFKIYRHCCCTFTSPGYVTRHWPIIIDLGMKWISCRHDWRLGILLSRFQVKSVVPNERIHPIYALTNASKQSKREIFHFISASRINFFICRAIFFLSFKQKKKIINTLVWTLFQSVDDRLEIRGTLINTKILFRWHKEFAISFLNLYNDISV